MSLNQNNYNLIPISEKGEGQENNCVVCGAKSGEACTGQDPDNEHFGIEYWRLIHYGRQKCLKK